MGRDTLLLVLGWILLSASVNVRYPAVEPSYWYFTPALDVTLIFLLFTILGQLGWRISKLVLVPLGFLFAFVRLFRITDGVTMRMQHRGTNLFIDSQLLPDLVRLAATAVPPLKLALMVLVGCLVLVLIGWGSYRVLGFAAQALRERRRALSFALLMGLALLTSPLAPPRSTPSWYQGPFTASVVPRFGEDFLNFWTSRSFPQQVGRQLAAHEFSGRQGLLAELRGNNVLLMFIESYGETLLRLDHYKEPINRAYKLWELTLRPAGFHMASTVMDSPTVGGYSWLAHITLATGIKVTDQVRYKSLYRMRPRTIVHYFREAGYDALIVQPATMRPPGPLIYPYTHHRYSWEFGYRGRNFSWAPMPDQFTLDFVQRNEISKTEKPLFVEYNLASGHMPWNDQAPLVNWDQLGDGSLFRTMPGIRFDTDWSKLDNAHPAYLQAMLYDLEVLRQYISLFVKDDSLLILLGDHQPVGEVTGNSESRGVPVHVISRNPRFIEKFVKRGYSQGMRPQNSPPYPGMETFLPQFLEDFSR